MVIGSFVRFVKIVIKLKVLEIFERFWNDYNYSALGYKNLRGNRIYTKMFGHEWRHRKQSFTI